MHVSFFVSSINASECSHFSVTTANLSVLINSLRTHTGAVPSLLHPQRRHWPGAPAHRQHLHEPAQAPGVLRPAPDEEQAAVRHRVLRRVRAELRRAKASLSPHPWTRRHRNGLGERDLKQRKKKKEEEGKQVMHWPAWFTVFVCVWVCACQAVGEEVITHRLRKRGARVKRGRKPFLESLLLLSNLNV